MVAVEGGGGDDVGGVEDGEVLGEEGEVGKGGGEEREAEGGGQKDTADAEHFETGKEQEDRAEGEGTEEGKEEEQAGDEAPHSGNVRDGQSPDDTAGGKHPLFAFSLPYSTDWQHSNHILCFMTVGDSSFHG